MIGRTRELVREEVARILPRLREYKAELTGKRAAIYTGGAFKAFSLIRALRTIGMETVVVGSQTGSRDDYDELREISDPGTILVDDTNPVELASFMKEKQVDLFIGGVKERPLAYKLGVAFCDHNHERAAAGRLRGHGQLRGRGPCLRDQPRLAVRPPAGSSAQPYRAAVDPDRAAVDPGSAIG